MERNNKQLEAQRRKSDEENRRPNSKNTLGMAASAA